MKFTIQVILFHCSCKPSKDCDNSVNSILDIWVFTYHLKIWFKSPSHKWLDQAVLLDCASSAAFARTDQNYGQYIKEKSKLAVHSRSHQLLVSQGKVIQFGKSTGSNSKSITRKGGTNFVSGLRSIVHTNHTMLAQTNRRHTTVDNIDQFALLRFWCCRVE